MQTSHVELDQETLLILGCGDIGLRLAKVMSGISVVGVRRQLIEHSAANLRMIQADLAQEESMDLILQQTQPDLILVTMTPNERSDQGYKKAYVQTCKRLIERISKINKKPRLILFVSSTSIYAQDNGNWVDESSLTDPQHFSGQRLREAENILRDANLPICIVRFSGIYGPGRERLIQQVKSGQLSASKSWTNRIHADDCARVLAHLINKQRTSGIEDLYLASDNCPAILSEVHLWLAEKMAIKNYTVADVINERGNKRVSNKRLIETGFSFLYASYKEGYGALLDDIHYNRDTFF